MDVVVREARESELAEIGALTAEIYEDLVSPEYLEVVRDARARFESPATTLLVGYDDGTDGLLGAVVHAAPGSPWRNVAVNDDETEIRMLCVRESARGRGVGETLVRACIARNRAAGLSRIVLCTEIEMKEAQRLYARLGFVRVPERDWSPTHGYGLLAYALEVPE